MFLKPCFRNVPFRCESDFSYCDGGFPELPHVAFIRYLRLLKPLAIRIDKLNRLFLIFIRHFFPHGTYTRLEHMKPCFFLAIDHRGRIDMFLPCQGGSKTLAITSVNG